MSEEQQSGIFEPKPLKREMIPESGAQKAKRILIVLAAAAVVVTTVLCVRRLWFRPVKRFYAGMSSRNIEKMESAFPDWLCNADMGEGNASIEDMCSVMISNITMTYGTDSKVSVSLAAYVDVEVEKLTQIAEGIRSRFDVNAKVTKGRVCSMNARYTAQDGKQYDKTEYVTMYRINGHWYILDVPNDTK